MVEFDTNPEIEILIESDNQTSQLELTIEVFDKSELEVLAESLMILNDFTIHRSCRVIKSRLLNINPFQIFLSAYKSYSIKCNKSYLTISTS